MVIPDTKSKSCLLLLICAVPLTAYSVVCIFFGFVFSQSLCQRDDWSRAQPSVHGQKTFAHVCWRLWYDSCDWLTSSTKPTTTSIPSARPPRRQISFTHTQQTPLLMKYRFQVLFIQVKTKNSLRAIEDDTSSPCQRQPGRC